MSARDINVCPCCGNNGGADLLKGLTNPTYPKNISKCPSCLGNCSKDVKCKYK